MEIEDKQRAKKNDFKPPSASKLQRQMVCPASVVLPKVESENPFSDRGTHVHSFLEKAWTKGRDYALSKTAAEYRDYCSDIDIETIKNAVPVECTPEVAFAYDAIEGKGRLIGTSIGRNYGACGQWELRGSADLYGRNDEYVYIADFKTVAGHDTYAPMARSNWQLKLLALAACRAFGLSSAKIAIIKIYNDGSVNAHDVHHMDAMELDDCAAQIKAFAERAAADHAAFMASPKRTEDVPKQVTGDHCNWCPSIHACPAQVSATKQIMLNTKSFEDKITTLTPELAGQFWHQTIAAEDMIKKAKEAIRKMAMASPIPLPGGKVLAPVEVDRESVDGMAVFQAVSEICDRGTAQAAVELSSSKEAIKKAIRQVAQTRGIPIAQLERQVLELVRAKGGVKTTSAVYIREVKPKE